ncbi:unnamed protein product [Tenebrio molitor]|nr:unnamed protein product [Tenebrio molitor]
MNKHGLFFWKFCSQVLTKTPTRNPAVPLSVRTARTSSYFCKYVSLITRWLLWH